MRFRSFVSLATVMVAAVALAAEEPAALLRRAESLAYTRRFDEAAQVYSRVLALSPSSRDAGLGLARVRLWQGRYGEARRRFEALLARNAHDADAAEGAATAAYWSGDFRTAEREFRALAVKHPDRETVRRSLAELRSASSTTESFDTGMVDDDQPFRSTRTAVRVSVFSDPLTRWDVTAGGYTVSSDAGGRHGVPFALLQNETVLPAWRMTLIPSFGLIRAPDGRAHVTGGASIRLRLSAPDSLALSFTRREMLSNATRLYPFTVVSALRWEHAEPWLASIGIEHDRFSDRNSAKAADAYVLWPMATLRNWKVWAGASALGRDTAESRFYVNGITATLDSSGSFFHYTYRGAYDPYWTPQHLLEGRLILAIERRFASGATMRLQGDGGRASDQAQAFWPDSGVTSFPLQIGQSPFDRSYWPWRVRFTSSMPFARGITLDVSIEHSVTTFYRANSVHATLARRR